MRASVLIGSYNEGTRLWRTVVESTLEGRIGSSKKIVVADDASKDYSIPELKKRFPQILVVENGERSAVAPTRGLGVRHSHGETLFFLDGHTRRVLGAVNRLVGSVERTSGIAIITPRIGGLIANHGKGCRNNSEADMRLTSRGSIVGGSWKKVKEVKVGRQSCFESPALRGICYGCEPRPLRPAMGIQRTYASIWS
jgi:hypothetical protein